MKASRVLVTFHGPAYSQYFQGHGLSSGYSECATGIGQSYASAVADALDSLAQMDIEVDDVMLDNALGSECGRSFEGLTKEEDYDMTTLHEECQAGMEDDECERHYFVSIDVTVPKSSNGDAEPGRGND